MRTSASFPRVSAGVGRGRGGNAVFLFMFPQPSLVISQIVRRGAIQGSSINFIPSFCFKVQRKTQVEIQHQVR